MIVFTSSLRGIAAGLIAVCAAFSGETPLSQGAPSKGAASLSPGRRIEAPSDQERDGRRRVIWNDNGVWRYDGRTAQGVEREVSEAEGGDYPAATPSDERPADPAYTAPTDRNAHDDYNPGSRQQALGGLAEPYPYQDYFPYLVPYYNFPLQSEEGYYGNPAVYSRDAYSAGYAEGFNSGKYDLLQGNYYNPRQYERSGDPDYFEGFVAGYQDGYRR